jgi:hypothetical protein
MRTHPISTRMTLVLAAIVLLAPLIVGKMHGLLKEHACVGAACAAAGPADHR